MYINNYSNDHRNKKLKIIFLTTILYFSVITNVFSISSFSSNFAFLKDVKALESKVYPLEYEKKKQKENNYHKDSVFYNSRYLSSMSESDLSPTSLGLDRKNNNYDNNQYKSIANIEKEIIKCNNLNVNLNVDGRSAINANNNDESNNNIFGQKLNNQKNEEFKTKNANEDNYKPFISDYDIEQRFAVIYKNFNDNELSQQQQTPPISSLPPDNTEILTVIKTVDCQASTQICDEQNLPIQPSQFNIVIEGNNPSHTRFVSSSAGTDIYLEPGKYSVTEEGLDSTTQAICSTMGFEAGRIASELGENLSICTNFSEECEGEITLGNPQTCTIHNVLVEKQISGNNIYVVWFSQSDDRDIFFSVSNNNGRTFSEPVNLSNDSGETFNQHMVVR